MTVKRSSPAAQCQDSPHGSRQPPGESALILERVHAASPCRDASAEPGSSPIDSGASRLILGDNAEVLAALLKGSQRRLPGYAGQASLIYIDPPFYAGRDFYVGRGADRGHEDEQVAYSDRWPSLQRYLDTLEARLKLLYKLLAPDGCIYVHCDWRVSARLRLMLENIFEIFVNEIIWHYTGGGRSRRHFSRKHDTIYVFARSAKHIFNADAVRVPYKTSSGYAKSGITSRAGQHYAPNPLGCVPDDVWDIPIVNPLASERTGYPTQKPEALLERIVLASSRPGDLVADVFCGSGTTCAVAERLGRRWLGVDSSPAAIETAEARILAERSRRQLAGYPLDALEIWRLAARGSEF